MLIHQLLHISGYEIAKQWSKLKNVKDSFNFTSNIDGHWIKSGWDQSAIVECHGSIHYMQCIRANCKQTYMGYQ